jgi:hypothetical protein
MVFRRDHMGKGSTMSFSIRCQMMNLIQWQLGRLRIYGVR